MRYLGLEQIPTFDLPHPAAALPQAGELGFACRGKQVEPCRAFLQKYSKTHVDDEVVRTTLCLPCKGTPA